MALLSVSNLSVGSNKCTIVSDVSFEMNKGEILGIVGESGCGKSTLLKSLIKLSDSDTRVLGGEIRYGGQDISRLTERELRDIRGAKISTVFQNPGTTLDPLLRIKDQFYECGKYHARGSFSKKSCYQKSVEMLKSLHFEDPDVVLNAYPCELSGGMNQRVAIAVAMLNGPDLILADEPTSALDVSVQSKVVRILLELRERHTTSIFMVTHNMKIVAEAADTVGVMYGGMLVEYGKKEEVLGNPAHPYTKALICAVPKFDGQLPCGIDGVPPPMGKERVGCPFYDRCVWAETGCRLIMPEVRRVSDTHWHRCIKE